MDEKKPRKKPRIEDDEELGWADEGALERAPVEEDVWDDAIDGDEDWEDEPLLEQPADEIDWTQAEDSQAWDESLEWEDEPPAPLEEAALPEELAVIGWRELAALPDWGADEIATRCSTTSPTSSLHVEMGPGPEGFVRLVLGARSLQVPLSSEMGELVVQAVIRLGGREFALPVRLHATSGAPLLIMGRDALAGRFLVDASQAWTEDGR